MRFSSIVSLLVVTASFALGGCAADAEPTSGETQPNVALTDPNANAAPVDKTREITQTGKLSDQIASPSLDGRARIGEHVAGQVDPRFTIQPRGFDAIPEEKLPVGLPQFHAVNPLLTGLQEEQGFTPYTHKPVP